MTGDFTIAEVCDLLHVSRSWVYRNRKLFRAYRIGRNVRITRESVMQYRGRAIAARLSDGLTINEIREQVRASA